MIFPESEGEAAVRAARKIAEAAAEGRRVKEPLPESFSVHAGVFVTINEHPSGHLRGCIGYPEPVMPLAEALADSAVSAATRDPRFRPMRPGEIDGCTVEVTILTPPEKLEFKDTADMLEKIVLGRDGIILEAKGRRALFLPQVATEQGWTKEETLDNLAWKAGLREDAWRADGIGIRTFRGEIFKEISPNGKVVRG